MHRSHVSLKRLVKQLEKANHTPNAVRLNGESCFRATYKYMQTYKHFYRPRGHLEITKKVDGKDASFKIDFQSYQKDNTLFKIDAKVFCENKDISIPTSWQYRSEVYKDKNQRISSVDLTRQATIEGGVLRFDADQPATEKIENLLTTNWTLMGDIHKVFLSETKRLTLDMCEDLLILRKGVRLEYIGSVAEPMPLNGYCCSGDLPSVFYWLDSNNQLVLATSMFAAFVLNEITLI